MWCWPSAESERWRSCVGSLESAERPDTSGGDAIKNRAWRDSRSAVGSRTQARDARRSTSSNGSWSCAARRRIGERASCASNWPSKGSTCRSARFTASCCATGWWRNKTAAGWRRSVSSGSSRTNCGRWTSKEYRQPGKQRGCCRCRSSTTTAATCWVCGRSSRPRRRGVRATLEEVFSVSGLPQQMLMDHGTPWWNSQGAGWTRFSVWLMQQGIVLRFSGIRHPQTQGKVERLHGSMQRAFQRRGRPRRREDWQPWLDAFREEYNHERPHEALEMATPASRWRPSERRFDPRPNSWEYAEGAWVRRVGVNGGLWLNGVRWEISRALAHEHVALERVGERILVRYCRTTVREIDLVSGCSLPVPVNLGDFVFPDRSSDDERELNRGWGMREGGDPLPSNSQPPEERSVNDVLVTKCPPCPGT